MTASHWSAWVGYLHCGAFAADFAERVEEEEEGLEEGVEVQAVPESSPVDIQQQLSALLQILTRVTKEKSKPFHNQLLQSSTYPCPQNGYLTNEVAHNHLQGPSLFDGRGSWLSSGWDCHILGNTTITDIEIGLSSLIGILWMDSWL
jgi:hypothetical protein